MPHSLVLNLLPASPIPAGYLTGKHLHALFLTLVSSVDQALGDRLHEQKASKAFTISPLQVLGNRLKVSGNREQGRGNKKTVPCHLSPVTSLLQWNHSRPIPAGTPCWWRISLLDDALFAQLSQLWLNLNPAHPWHLGPADLQITSILGTPQSTQSWANFSPYDQLYDRASEQNRQISFAICTPATFRQGKYDSALPTRECLFNSLLNRWHQYSPIALPDHLIECLFPSFFNIRTEIISDYRGKSIGCVGVVNYRILGEAEPATIKAINALADFALYAGVGRKTAMGMGMVRRVDG